MRTGAYRIAQLHAIAVGTATLGGVITVLYLRAKTRRRPVPFYSDATHNDPERTLLALAENLGLALLPLVALSERAQHERLMGAPLPIVAQLNSLTTFLAFIAFWGTANTPTVKPYITTHQLAASSLMVLYAIQATCKARIARIIGSRAAPHWVRNLIATALWGAIVATMASFWVPRLLGSSNKVRTVMTGVLAACVHIATASCIALMFILARDLRHETVLITAQGTDPCDVKRTAVQ